MVKGFSAFAAQDIVQMMDSADGLESEQAVQSLSRNARGKMPGSAGNPGPGAPIE